MIIQEHKLKEVAFIAGKSENQADKKKFIRFSIDNKKKMSAWFDVIETRYQLLTLVLNSF